MYDLRKSKHNSVGFWVNIHTCTGILPVLVAWCLWQVLICKQCSSTARLKFLGSNKDIVYSINEKEFYSVQHPCCEWGWAVRGYFLHLHHCLLVFSCIFRCVADVPFSLQDHLIYFVKTLVDKEESKLLTVRKCKTPHLLLYFWHSIRMRLSHFNWDIILSVFLFYFHLFKDFSSLLFILL